MRGARTSNVTAMAGCNRTGRGAQGSITDADVALQSMYTWTIYELGADGVTFARLQCANGDMRCIVNTVLVPAQSPRPSKGDVVLQVCNLQTVAANEGPNPVLLSY